MLRTPYLPKGVLITVLGQLAQVNLIAIGYHLERKLKAIGSFQKVHFQSYWQFSYTKL
ncbi:unnamed protein product [Larinioides sclopetarius]|uniref:Uncharacterized protein n=1 Tax=Larinioides sclopetarius TaxID=280406 RepID=A0AAV2C0W9_9ARAC